MTDQPRAGVPYTLVLTDAQPGLVEAGLIGVRIKNVATDEFVLARSSVGIDEEVSGVYTRTYTWAAGGTYLVAWDDTDGTEPIAAEHTFAELVVVLAADSPAESLPEGSPYFTVAEFKTKYPELDYDADYSDDDIASTRALAEDALEDATGQAFVPRPHTEVLGRSDFRLGGRARLSRRAVRSITSVIDDAADPVDYADAQIDGRWVRLPGGWGEWPVTISYTHGFDAPPRRVKQAAMALTRVWLVEGPLTKRATQEIRVEGGGAINLATPGMFGSEFGVPEVDAVVRRYRRKVRAR